MSGSRGSLRPALLLLTAARLVINTAHRMSSPFLPVIARGLGIPLEQAGALVAARSAAAMATPVVITAGRRRDRRTVIQLGIVMFVAGAVLTAATNAYIGALFGFGVMGLGKAVFDVSGQAYLSDRTPYAKRARYIALFEVTWAGGFLIGAPAVGLIIDIWGWAAAFYITGGLAGLSVFGAQRFVQHDEPGDGESGKLVLNRSSIALLAAAGLFSGASEFISVVLGAWFEDAFMVALGAIAGLTALIGLFELSGSSLTAAITDRVGKRRAVMIGLVVGAVGYLFMAVGRDTLVLGVGAAMLAFAAFEFTIVSTFPLASEAAPNARARYLALVVVTINAGRTVAAFLGTRVFVSLGFGANALLALVLNLAAFALMLAFVVDHEDSPQASP
ncbi:MAG: MFS transporter [Acidimicrobiia bacterium]|nr:MFS transporter [Acidimicrobiia bacterium]